MFIHSEETSTKQIFEQTLSLITFKFCVLRCQTTKGKKEKYIRYNILQVQLTTGIAKGTRKSLTTYNSGCLSLLLYEEARHVPIYPFTKICIICKTRIFEHVVCGVQLQ